MQYIELIEEEQDFKTKEAYKTLRTNIEFSGDDVKVICVTSCRPDEGKSEISHQLAKAFALNGKKTLLIDADLRKSVMRSICKKGKVKYSLINFLVGQCALRETICVTDQANLFVIFAGHIPPNPSELLGNSRFAKMIESARQSFDMIIIDTPPLGSVIDTAIVAKHCDGGLIVVEAGGTSYRHARIVKEQLSVTGCRILGCVLNKVSVDEKGYYGSYYNGNYENYGYGE